MSKTTRALVEIHLFSDCGMTFAAKVSGLPGHMESIQDIDQTLRMWSRTFTQTIGYKMQNKARC